jgi:hypothetical protein
LKQKLLPMLMGNAVLEMYHLPQDGHDLGFVRDLPDGVRHGGGVVEVQQSDGALQQHGLQHGGRGSRDDGIAALQQIHQTARFGRDLGVPMIVGHTQGLLQPGGQPPTEFQPTLANDPLVGDCHSQRLERPNGGLDLLGREPWAFGG